MKERVGQHCRRENLLKPQVSSFESPQASFAARSSLPLAGQEAGRDVRENAGTGLDGSESPCRSSALSNLDLHLSQAVECLVEMGSRDYS